MNKLAWKVCSESFLALQGSLRFVWITLDRCGLDSITLAISAESPHSEHMSRMSLHTLHAGTVDKLTLRVTVQEQLRLMQAPRRNVHEGGGARCSVVLRVWVLQLEALRRHEVVEEGAAARRAVHCGCVGHDGKGAEPLQRAHCKGVPLLHINNVTQFI